MGKIQDMGQGRLQIIYGGLESPISGIDASKVSDIYLNPNALAEGSGLFVQDGYLSSVYINAVAKIPLFSTPGAYVVGDVQLSAVVGSTSPYTVTKASYGFVIVSYATQLTVYEFHNGFVANNADTTISINANLANTLTYYVVNGVVYITGLGLGAIYAYTPAVAGSSTLTLLTNYVGGQFLGELNGRLLCLCCDSIVGGVYTYSPYQISWSAASGAYGIWNPLSGGLVTGAGFNNLPDVADEITGFFSIGPTGYIIRKQGISEMTPLNSGIQPFDFNHMWASNKGVGSVYPNTVKQYGSLGGFLSDTGVYTLGYGGINTIQGVFWGQITDQLKQYFQFNFNYSQYLTNVAGAIVPLTIATETNLHYLLYIPSYSTATSWLFIGNVLTQDWNIVSVFNNQQLAVSVVKIAAISNSAVFNTGTDQTVPIISAVFLGNYLYLFNISDTETLPNSIQPDIPGLPPNCTFPIEEVATFKDITVNAIAFYADGEVSGTDYIQISPNVSNKNSNCGPQAQALSVNYKPVNLSAENTFVVSYPPDSGGFCGKFPQLSLGSLLHVTANSSFRIYKIVMFCSYDSKQVP